MYGGINYILTLCGHILQQALKESSLYCQLGGAIQQYACCLREPICTYKIGAVPTFGANASSSLILSNKAFKIDLYFLIERSVIFLFEL